MRYRIIGGRKPSVMLLGLLIISALPFLAAWLPGVLGSPNQAKNSNPRIHLAVTPQAQHDGF